MRIVVDPRIPDGLADIRRSWSFAETLEAHLTLDALDVIEAHQRRQADAQRRA